LHANEVRVEVDDGVGAGGVESPRDDLITLIIMPKFWYFLRKVINEGESLAKKI
jgi:hypothetical protein